MKLSRQQKIVIAVLIALIACYFLIVPFREWINSAVGAISDVNLETTIDYIRDYGSLAAVISFFLMILQSIVSPIPAFLITLANAAIFGWVWGAVLSWSSAMAGAALCYYIARVLGRDVVVKITSDRALRSLDSYFDRYGKHTIVVLRLLPFISFDIVSYAAGLTSMGFWPFFIATGIGQLPATIVYSYIGQNLSSGGQTLFYGLLMLFAVSIIIFIWKDYHNRKKQKQNQVESAEM